jgi:SAM-dependent methyltransferase
MARTYLAGVRFCGLSDVLYYQRVRPDSTVPVRHQAIQQTSAAMKNRNLHRLVFEWCRRQELPMYDLGGAHDCPKDQGFLALDRVAAPGVDVVCDVRGGLPFADNSVGCLRAVDFLEHLPAGPAVVAFMNEAHRVLAPGGWLLSSTPSVVNPDGSVGVGAFSVPDHLSHWGPLSARYFTEKRFAAYLDGLAVRFQAVRNFVHYPGDWYAEHRVGYLVMDLMKLTGLDHFPGMALI